MKNQLLIADNSPKLSFMEPSNRHVESELTSGNFNPVNSGFKSGLTIVDYDTCFEIPTNSGYDPALWERLRELAEGVTVIVAKAREVGSSRSELAQCSL